MAIDSLTRERCPACRSVSLADYGKIHHAAPATVAGVAIELGDSTYRLLACADCRLLFKSPPVDEQRLMDCYAASKFNHWRERPDPVKRRFDELLALVKRFAPGPDVLDIGCFNGAMLEFFGPEYRRSGIEPSREATAIARERGVDVLGSTVMELSPTPRFDAVLAVDVLEHIAAPVPFLDRVASLLRPGGVFISLTGDVDSWGWRLQKARYWYCSLPEHVTFFGRRSLGGLLDRAGIDEVWYQRVTHQRDGRLPAARDLIKNIAFSSVVGLGCEHLSGIGPRLRRRAPGWITACDHMLHVGRKRAE